MRRGKKGGVEGGLGGADDSGVDEENSEELLRGCGVYLCGM